MAKGVSLTASELNITKPRMGGGGLQRGSVPSAELVPMQFRMTPEFVRAFKQEALNRNLKLNALLKECFEHFMKTAR